MDDFDFEVPMLTLEASDFHGVVVGRFCSKQHGNDTQSSSSSAGSRYGLL